MSAIGVLQISRTNDHPAAVARVAIFGPRGGFVGDVLIDRENAREQLAMLRRLPGIEPASMLDDLLANREIVARALIDYAAERRGFHETIGKDFPEHLKAQALADADVAERIGKALA